MTRLDQFKIAFKILNNELFRGELPAPVIDIRDDYHEFAAFYQHRSVIENTAIKDYLAINDRHFADNQTALALLLHEMVHQWEQHNSDTVLCDHSVRWTNKMISLGIDPLERNGTGKDQIIAGSKFDQVATKLISHGFSVC